MDHKFAVNIGNYLQLGFWVFPDVGERPIQSPHTNIVDRFTSIQDAFLGAW